MTPTSARSKARCIQRPRFAVYFMDRISRTCTTARSAPRCDSSMEPTYVVSMRRSLIECYLPGFLWTCISHRNVLCVLNAFAQYKRVPTSLTTSSSSRSFHHPTQQHAYSQPSHRSEDRFNRLNPSRRRPRPSSRGPSVLAAQLRAIRHRLRQQQASGCRVWHLRRAPRLSRLFCGNVHSGGRAAQRYC